MKFNEMIARLRLPAEIEIRNKHNERICECMSDSMGVKPYLDIDVLEWFPNSINSRGTHFTVFLDVDEKE